MTEFQWPYPNIKREIFQNRISFVEAILQKYDAQHIGRSQEVGRWILDDGTYAIEKLEKNIWLRNQEYIRVDRVYFTEKPFLVLEFSNTKEGPFEDADPFPYDLSDVEIEEEIKFALGIN